MINKPDMTETDLQSNYQEFLDFVEKKYSGERKKNLLKMYSEEELGMSLVMAPASTCEHFHLAHPGGYIQHIMNVIKLSFGVKKLWQSMGCNIDFTDDEMLFAAMHHDLGKLGDKELGEYYQVETENWKVKKGEIYTLNPNIQYMEVTDRAVYTLQKYGVKMTWKEYLGIKLADGMYNETSKTYLKTGQEKFFLKTNLPRIIHHADYTASRAEFDSWKFSIAKEVL